MRLHGVDGAAEVVVLLDIEPEQMLVFLVTPQVVLDADLAGGVGE